MKAFLTLFVFASCGTVWAFLHPVRQVSPSFDVCANRGCSETGSRGNSCFAAVGTIDDYDNWNASPQNVKEVRDCICGSNYWRQLAQCRDCLVSQNLYPTVLPELITPVSAMSTSFCSPDGGRTNTNTIDGWFDSNTYDEYHMYQLRSISTTPTDGSSPYTGIGGDAVETVIAETVFDSLISAASTETGLVSAMGSTSATTRQSVTTRTQGSTSRSVTSLTTTGSDEAATPTSSSPASSIVGGTTSITTGTPADITGSGDAASSLGSTVPIRLFISITTSLLVAVLRM